MITRRLARDIVIGLAIVSAPAVASAETLYFKNMRTLEVESYEIKGSMIWVTLAGGRTYPMRGDSVDWEGTERLRQGGFQLEKVDYSMADPQEDGDDGMIAGEDTPLTAADLRKVGKGLKLRRAAAPSLVVEVDARESWVDSGINVKQGQSLAIRAVGQASLGGGVSSGPVGLGGEGGRDSLVNTLPRGALMARVGLGGTAVPLGPKIRFRPRGAGRLYLAVNDATPSDNSGGYRVKVTLPRAPSASRGSGTMSTGGSLSPPSEGSSEAASSPPPPPPRRAVPKGMTGAVERSRRSVGNP